MWDYAPPKVSAIAKALAGDVARLWSAFVWDQTHQGHDYWELIASGEAFFDDEARQFAITLMFFQLGKEMADAHH